MILTILAVVLILGVIVIVHEFGHYLSARTIGVAVQEFSVGVGPALWKKQGRHTLFSFRCIPFGGYCLFDSELEGSDGRGRPLSIVHRKALPKMYISFGGPVMNFLLSALVFTILFSFIGVSTGYEPVIGEVQTDSPAGEAGILPGDRILSIDGESLSAWADLSRILTEKQDRTTLTFIIQRGADRISLPVEPRYYAEEGRVMIGVTVDGNYAIIERFPPLTAIGLGLRQTWIMIGLLISAISQMVSGQIDVAENLSGPVELAHVIGQTVTTGLPDTLFLTAFLSVNLGIMNLLPVPALDGGRILIYLVELVRRKPMNLHVEGWINALGFALLISLMVLLTFKDIFKLFGGS
ncbi:MAG: RIP metalloprotease RseP [Clostridiales bacterium]|nr:RIP metalloprotease RseP [Clostridiales bacterium]